MSENSAQDTNSQIQERMRKVEAAFQNAQAAKREILRGFIGQDEVVNITIACMAAKGHLLLNSVPGQGKTRLATLVRDVFDLKFNRIQGTPDLTPSDIIGTPFLTSKEGEEPKFSFKNGPVFTDLLLADELNRAPPKVQSALLQAMQEREVTTIEGVKSLGAVFQAIATINPVEGVGSDGTYSLPEAQLDRFMMSTDVPYPSEEIELDIMLGKYEKTKLETQLSRQDLLDLQEAVNYIEFPKDLAQSALKAMRSLRPNPNAKSNILLGPSTRALEVFAQAAKGYALTAGSKGKPSIAVQPEHIKAIVLPSLKHRMIRSMHATPQDLEDEIKQAFTEHMDLSWD